MIMGSGAKTLITVALPAADGGALD